MSSREIYDSKNGIAIRESYGFRDEVVKRVVDKFVDRSNIGYEKYGQTLHDERPSNVKFKIFKASSVSNFFNNSTGSPFGTKYASPLVFNLTFPFTFCMA